MSTPLLSIGMIFRNDIRSLERCLKALAPLRAAVSCELVMADTGSDDGSREVAEKYADILFDFHWVDDFSAARNAVMDRCSGTWFFTVDSDEYLDSNISELVSFLQCAGQTIYVGAVIQRNYSTWEMDSSYSDFGAARLLRMSTGLRYQGSIHERWVSEKQLKIVGLSQTILHHDGYVGLGEGKGKEKLARNLKLLREALEREPDNLTLRFQYLESGALEPDFVDQLRRALEMVKAKQPGWKTLGPPILRYAVRAANQKELPELEEWIAWAEDWFPDSYHVRLDVEYIAFVHSWEKKDYADCIRRGERYLQNMADYRVMQRKVIVQIFSAILMGDPYWEQGMKISLANAYLKERQPQRTVELLETLDHTLLDGNQTRTLVLVLRDLHSKTAVDTVPLVTAVWDGILTPKPSKKRANERRDSFLQIADGAFSVVENERNDPNFCRPAYALFLPLSHVCEAGRAAAILETEDVLEIERYLSGVESWKQFPALALFHALKCGAGFPLPDKPLNLEEMDILAGRLAVFEKKKALQWAIDVDVSAAAQNPQALCWARGMILAAEQTFPWGEKDADTEQGMALARVFANVERVFLPLCYAPAALGSENLFLLPPMHRFGWYCVQAFDALDAGDTAGYVHLLREGLEVCEGAKDMAQFLMDHTPELQVCKPSTEMLTLAEQVRTVLAAYGPDNPAVAALKQSEAYQMVAYLIEGLEPPVVGGLPQ